MATNKKNSYKILSAMIILIIIFSSCNLSTYFNKSVPVVTSTPTLAVNLGDIENDLIEDTSSIRSDEPVKTISVIRMDGTEEDVPDFYTSLTDLLKDNIDSGEWTEGEGLVKLLRFLTGEINKYEIPEINLVIELNGTGVARWGQDYLNDVTNDQDIRTEIERLLSIIFPSQEILDSISLPYNNQGNVGSAKVARMNQQASQSDCQDLASLGFGDDFFLNGHCYLYKEIIINGFSYRVYFPFWWQGDAEFEVLIEGAISALTDSVVAYNNFGDMENINMMFSLLPDATAPTTLAFQSYTPKATTCPITILPGGVELGMENFKQTIAHEVFHCFQDWNFTTEPYAQNKWWGEGSAEYFSNVVYPSTNYEHRFLDQFDVRSRNQPLNIMSYENFIFFQHAANTYGNYLVIDLLRTLGNSGGSLDALASFQAMDETFFNFVFDFLSKGIKDTNGQMIYIGSVAVTAMRQISEKKEETFQTRGFVATRYGLIYLKEKRFLQSPEVESNVKYSTVENRYRPKPDKWSALPPELRSECEKDVLYLLAITTINTSENKEFKANIEEVEKAYCDPCLLGVWDVDANSFEAFITDLFNEAGGFESTMPGAELLVEIDGHDYIEFNDDGKVNTRQENFSITFGATGLFTFNTIVDSQGNGNYTADGENLEIFNLVNFVNQVDGYMNGLPISLNQVPGSGTYNSFGQSVSGPGVDNNNDQQSISGTYVCTNDTLTIDQPGYKEIMLNRVYKILPTPMPTPGSTLSP